MTGEFFAELMMIAHKYNLDIKLPSDRKPEEKIGDIQILIDLKEKELVFCPGKEDFDTFSKEDPKAGFNISDIKPKSSEEQS